VAGDEQVRTGIMQPRQTAELTAAESWRLLASVSLGRIVFTQHAMPAIRPVNHLVDDKTVIIRSHLGAAIVFRADGGGTVVCYEADDIDPVLHTGWSVIVTGMARLVRDPAAISRYQQLLHPWADGQMNYIIAISPQVITGLRLAACLCQARPARVHHACHGDLGHTAAGGRRASATVTASKILNF
jgi:nitroimidazol reductase NimA-like FMN-containing flavoprotein (pyridoxamine 5'-phosphate oxidase superfamily)